LEIDCEVAVKLEMVERQHTQELFCHARCLRAACSVPLYVLDLLDPSKV